MRAREFIRPALPVNEQQLDEILPALTATASAVGRGAMAAGQLAARGAQAVGQGVVKGAQAVGGVIKQGAQAAGQAVANTAQQMTPQQKQQVVKGQQTMASTLPQLKNLGVDINPQLAQQSLNKADNGTALSSADKDNIAKLAPAVGDIISNPQLAGQFKSLLQKAQDQQAQNQQPNQSGAPQ
jgi:hypothetical protein